MKKLLLSLLFCAFGSVLCFAEPTTPPANPTHPLTATHKAPNMKSFVGKVESVSAADAAKGTKSEIVVLDEAGKKMTFLVKGTTTFYEAAGAATTMDKIKAGDKIKVRYETSSEGVEEAKAIRII